MARETFDWCYRTNAQGGVRFRQLAAQFGDGYRQTAGDGINSEAQVWPLQFVGSEVELVPIVAFLRRHKDGKAFFWTPPLGERGYYTVVGFDPVPLGGKQHTISVTFTQTFRP